MQGTLGGLLEGLSRRQFLATLAATTGLTALAGQARAVPRSTPAGPFVETRLINPPRLETANLGEQILCYRPMRKGSPRLGLEQIGPMTVVHNYGHGGSGWTLAPGSAQYVVDLVDSSKENIAKTAPVTVLGAGVIGLFTAYELVKRGYTNITVVADRFDRLTSHNAGGLLAPVSMDNNPQMQVVIDRIGIDAYRFYASVARGVNSDFQTGAVVVPAYFTTREESGLEPYVGKVMGPAKAVILDFGNGTKRPMVAYDDGIFMDPGGMMQGLTDFLKDKVVFRQAKINEFSELRTNLVFNCTGLGAAKLGDDKNMVSVQGHLVMLKNQVPADLQSMFLVYLPEGKTVSGQKVKRSFYLFPKRLPGAASEDIGVIGGTFIEGGSPETPNPKEFELLVQGARRFYGL